MRWSPSLLFALVAVVVGGLVLVDLRSPSSATDSPDPIAAGPAVGGAWFCAAGAQDEANRLELLTASPPGPANPSDTEIQALVDGQSPTIASQSVFPGSARRLLLGDSDVTGEAVGAAVRWWEQPTATSRTWRIRGGAAPNGIVTGPCAPRPSPTWYVPGLSTAGGGVATLYLANPFAADASVRISFTTPAGPEAPLLLENVSVPASSVAVVDLADHVPRQADIGVAVETRSGRVVVEGVQQLDPAVGGVEAASLVRAAPRLAESWTIPWSLVDPTTAEEGAAPAPTSEPTGEATEAPADPAEPPADPADGELVRTESPGNGTASWIWVANPNEDAAALSVTLHTPDGPVVPDIGGELMVDGGEQLRVDLRGLLPPGQSTAGVTVRSDNQVPIVAGVSSLMEPESGDVASTGYTSQLGWPEADPSWVVPGEPPRQRDQVLHVANPGAEPATVDVAVWNGARLVEPAALQGVEVAPGAMVEMDVSATVEGAAQFVAFVTASEGEVVAGRHGVGGDRADWVAHTGVPSSLWSGGDVVPPVDHDAQLVERMGTTGGLPSPQPDELDGEEPTSEPTTPLPTSVPTTPVPSAPPPTTPPPTTPPATEATPTSEPTTGG